MLSITISAYAKIIIRAKEIIVIVVIIATIEKIIIISLKRIKIKIRIRIRIRINLLALKSLQRSLSQRSPAISSRIF